ncbi:MULTISPECIES: PTS mannose/fructose/sorbose/N-acetylgalactosamine transporter subunit IIC [Holdemanella]|uniref:PTS system sorbose-specific iic component n=1 Tax=Holdemanella biformis DSM 3989 TaxID=518637 RepID=B7CBW4_9FIRM|nr:PTS sugar transporter subunit IIC [Holdemanella biformis]EEC89733.1 PTS system sorbose-specific iic component [Holdemanella biformis DSM 3989]
MHISILQAILIGLVYYLGANGTPWFTVNLGWAFRRPLLQGVAVGIILGDPVKGCIVGAAINATYLAQITAGGAQTMDEGLAGCVGTALAIISGTSAQVAVSLAVPISLLGNLVWMIYMTGDIAIVHAMDKVVNTGDVKKIVLWNIIPSQIFKMILYVTPVAIAVFSGADVITGMLDSLKGTPVIDCLTTIGTILPALGIAMNFKAILSNTGNRAYLYFLLGFVLYTYMNLPLLVIGLLAVIMAFLQKSEAIAE